MDLPGPALLKQTRLHVSAEGRGLAYYVADLANGRVLTVSRKTAAAFLAFRSAVMGQAEARNALTEADASEGFRVLSYLRAVRDQERLGTKRFNPLFFQIPLFDVGPYQTHIAGFARLAMGWPGAIVVFLLVWAALMLGVRNDWAIAEEYRSIFSIEALLTFGLVAPFLKIIHEFGHVTVATWAGVRVRKSGINFVGLYPLPHVDCSDADLSARRRHRILISLAGLMTDICVGLAAFILWHLVEGDYLRTLLGRVLVFSTINSLVFNINPLMKLDGYYAFVDLIGQRNLGTRGMHRFAALRNWVLSLGATGTLPRNRLAWTEALYGIASAAYRMFVLYVITMNVMPQFLGVGLFLAVWGGYVMFVSPLLADPQPGPAMPKAPASRLWGGRLGFAAIGLAALSLIPVSPVLRLPLHLDVSRNYAINAGKAGTIAEIADPGHVLPGDVLVRLVNPELQRQADLMALHLTEAQLFSESVRGVDAAKAQLADDRIASVVARADTIRQETESLTRRSDVAGTFLPDHRLRVGQFLRDGAPLGQVLPGEGPSRLTGAFPERWVERFQNEVRDIELHDGTSYQVIDMQDVAMVEVVRQDAASGLRTFELDLRYDLVPPARLASSDVTVKFRFKKQPAWRHAAFWLDGRIAAFRDAQLADRQRRISGGE